MPQQFFQEVERLKTEAQRAHDAGNLDQAVALLTKAIKACNSKQFNAEAPPDFFQQRSHLLSVLYSNRAAIRALTHAYVEALVDAKAAIQNDGSWPKPYLRKATALLGLGQPHAALQVLDRGVAACPGQAWALESVKADVEVAAEAQRRSAKRQRRLPPLLALSPTGRDSPVSKPVPALANGHTHPPNGHTSQHTSVITAAKGAGNEGVQGGPELVAFALDLLDKAAVAQGRTPGPQKAEDKVPITVISGFLGAGKTTLLRRILASGADHPDAVQAANTASGSAPASAPAASGAGSANAPLLGPNGSPFKFGVVVNDMASVNIDGTLASDAAAVHTASHVVPGDRDSDASPASNIVEMSNGCICCGLKGDMILEVAQLLCTSPTINYLIIESTGVGQPMPIAAAFASPDPKGRTLLDYVRLDTLVTVVDAPRFHEDMRAAHTPASAAAAARLLSGTLADGTHSSAAPAADPATHNLARLVSLDDPALMDSEDNRPLAELLAEQVEFADVVVVNKVDACQPGPEASPARDPPSHSVTQIKEIIKSLNPGAHLVLTNFCEVPLSEIINTNRFDFESAQTQARWQQELLIARDASAPALSTSHIHETEIYNIRSTVYEARRPFHPGRLRTWLNTGLLAALQPDADHARAVAATQSATTELIQPQLPTNLLRSKGFFWLASCPQVAWEWSSAGAAGRLAPYGEWLAGKLPRRCWPAPGKRAGWDPVWGDRCCSLVFITHGNADLSVIKTGLDQCLLTDEELHVADQPPATDGNGPAPSSETAPDSQEGGAEENEESEDSVWFRREQAWETLPGAAAWDALMQD